jgi:hypothetical protein
MDVHIGKTDETGYLSILRTAMSYIPGTKNGCRSKEDQNGACYEGGCLYAERQRCSTYGTVSV